MAPGSGLVRMVTRRPSGNWMVRRFMTSRREPGMRCALPTRAPWAATARRLSRAAVTVPLREEAFGAAAALREEGRVFRSATVFCEAWFLIAGLAGGSPEGAWGRRFSLDLPAWSWAAPGAWLGEAAAGVGLAEFGGASRGTAGAGVWG